MLITDKNKGSGIVINPKQNNSSAPVDLWVGIDAGSTQTRVCIADPVDRAVLVSDNAPHLVLEKLETCMYVIPSTYAVVPDEREIRPMSDNIEDNYDSHIIRVRTKAVNPMVNNDRIVRGRKITDASGLVPRFFDSSSNKMENSIFYTNVIDSIGYAILQKYSGKIPEVVRIHMVLSVRPQELDKPCLDKMDSNFIGEFVFRWGDVNIRMHFDDATYTTEPEAQLNGYTAIMNMKAVALNDESCLELAEKLNNGDTFIHIEGGGSSIGVEVNKDGELRGACSTTFQLGGNYLIRVIRDRLRSIKGRMISEDSVQNAIQTCVLKNGREREDISAVIADCKNDVGFTIFERLKHDVIDTQMDIYLTDMDFITLGGRLFREDDCGNSIAHYFGEYIKQVSPNTEIIVLKDNYIPQGNLVEAIVKFAFSDEHLEENAE